MNKILLLALLLMSGCSSLFYFPDRTVYATPKQFKLNHFDTVIVAEDGTRLHAQFITGKKSQKKSGTLLYFHGNAQNLSSHFLHVAWLANHGFDVLVFDYRGYGRSWGKPNQKGLQQDARAALDWAREHHKEAKTKKFIVYGQSLGGVVSMRALLDYPHKKEIDLVVMDSTFSSYTDLAFDKLTSTWFTFLLSPLAYVLVSDSTAPDDDIKNFDIPLLSIHGKKDLVVPYEFGKEIYEMAKGKKWLWAIENGIHTDVFTKHDRRYREKFLSFIDANI